MERTVPINCGCGGTSTISLVSLDGRSTPTRAHGIAEGWLDADHLVIRSDDQIKTARSSIGMYDIISGITTPIQAPGFFGGVLPGGF